MSSTDDGLPIAGVGGGDPVLIHRRVVEARAIVDKDDRAARLYFLGRGLLDCDDPDTGEEAVRVLAEAMTLGSSHAALDLGALLLTQADTPDDLRAALALIERAANDGLTEAQVLLGEVLKETPATRAIGEAWLLRAGRG